MITLSAQNIYCSVRYHTQQTKDEAYLPGVKAPAQKEVYCAPPGEDTNGSRDAESQHQLAVYSNCPPDTKPTNVKHKITTYNQDHAFLHILSFDLIKINGMTDGKYEIT